MGTFFFMSCLINLRVNTDIYMHEYALQTVCKATQIL